MPDNPLIYEETFYVATKLCLKCGKEILTVVESYPGLPHWRELPGGKISNSYTDWRPGFDIIVRKAFLYNS